MENQTPIEIMLQVGEDGRVSARNTYCFLELDPGSFTRWAKANITDNQLASLDEDYTDVCINAEYGNPLTGGKSVRTLTDYRLTVSFAKKLCMKAGGERGEQARDYFIKVEDKLKTIALSLTTHADAKTLGTREVAKLLKVIISILDKQKSAPHVIAKQAYITLNQFGFSLLPEAEFVKAPAYEHLPIPALTADAGAI